MNNLTLDPHLQSAVDNGVPALDIMHGELKSLMLYSEEQLAMAVSAEEFSGSAIDSMERRYWEGICEAYAHLYQLTYSLSFAIADKDK